MGFAGQASAFSAVKESDEEFGRKYYRGIHVKLPTLLLRSDPSNPVPGSKDHSYASLAI